MFRILSLVCFVALFVLPKVGSAQDPVSPKKQDPKVTYAPSNVPDRIILTWSSDPTTSQSVTWRTSTNVTKGLAEFAIAQGGPAFKKNAVRIAAKTQALKTGLGEAHYHTAVFNDLKPETKYLYRVGDGTNWSEWSQFETASKEAKPFSFIYFGDAQNDIKSHWARVVRQAFRDAPKAAFLLHAGDLVNNSNSDAEWGEWFYSGGWINRTMPSIATPGNHEYKKGKLSIQWQPSFDFPRNGPEKLSETVYFMDYQGVRFVSLNSNVDQDIQVKWFDKMMKSNNNRWTIVTMHHPIFSTNARRDNKALREKFKPMFDRHKIDLVLQGHDHAYGRTGLVGHEHKEGDAKPHPEQVAARNIATGVTARSEKAGTIYVVSVSGPKMYSVEKKPVFKTMKTNTQLYQILSVDGDKLIYSAYTSTGKTVRPFRTSQRGREAKPARRNGEVGGSCSCSCW